MKFSRQLPVMKQEQCLSVRPSKKCVIAPNDGGVDVTDVDSTEKRDKLKTKYKEWLSDQEDRSK